MIKTKRSRNADNYIPVPENVGALLDSEFCPMKFEAVVPHLRSEIDLNIVTLGAVGVGKYSSMGAGHGVRTSAHIRADGIDEFLLLIPLNTSMYVSHAHREAEIVKGEAAFISSRIPFDVYLNLSDEREFVRSSINVRVPGPMLRQRIPYINQICNQPISLESGSGQILLSVISASLEFGHDLHTEQIHKHGSAIVELLSSFAQSLPENRVSVSSSAMSPSQANVVQCAKHFIEKNLSNPNLDASAVATHCGISLRYLHKSFSSEPLSISKFIREHRLLRVRQALKNVDNFNCSITQIAYAWGFRDASNFGRLYRKRFGVSPRDDRSDALTRLPEWVD